MGPQSDFVTVALAAIGALVAVTNTIVAAFIYVQTKRNTSKVEEVHQLVNSRTSELITAATGQAHAEGVLVGEQAQRDRAPDPNGGPPA